MIFDPRALWTREDVAEYLQVTTRYVDQLRTKLPPPVMVGKRLPRWKAGDVMSWAETGAVNGND